MKSTRFKQISTGLLAGLLSVSLLAGCNTDSKESKNADATKESNEKGSFSMAIRTLAIPHVENSPDINKDETVLKMEELSNTDIDIRLLPHNEYKTKMDLMFASGDIPDVVQGMGKFTNSGQSMEQAVEAGVFLPLDDLLKEHGPNLLKYIPEEIWDTQRYHKDGKIYGIPQMLSNPARRATLIRKDLLDKAGLEIPKTVEETLEVLRAFKEMGVEQPFVARKGLSYSDTFFGAYDVQALFELDKSGNPIPKYFDSKNMKAAIQAYKTMYDEGLIQKEFLTQEANQYKNVIMSGQGGMFSANANVLNSWEKKLKETVPDGDLAIIPSPIGTDDHGGYVLYEKAFRNYLINAEAESPEKIIQFFDWMVSEEAQELFTYGIEGVDYTKENGKINYKLATTADEINKEAFRTGWLWFVGDATYTEGILELTPEGKELMGIYDNVLSKEGNGGLYFEPPLTTFESLPALQDKNADGPSDFLMEHIVKMITSQEDINDWDKVLEEWKQKGGDKYLEEAKAQYEEGKYTSTVRD